METVPVNVPSTGLVTAEAVALDVRPARLGSRAAALLIDIVVEAVLAGVLILLLLVLLPLLPGDLVDAALVSAMRVVVIAVVLLGYPTVVETWSNGRSAGKAALGLRVIRQDGGPIRLRHAFTRALIGFAVEWPGLLMPFLTWAGSLTTMIASEQGRRLGDLAAGTLVVHVRRPVEPRPLPGTPIELARWASAADLAALDDELAGAVGQFLTRAPGFSEPHGTTLHRMLYAEVVARVTPPPPPHAPSWLVLSAVLAERRRRSTAQLVANRVLTDRLLPGFGRPAVRNR